MDKDHCVRFSSFFGSVLRQQVDGVRSDPPANARLLASSVEQQVPLPSIGRGNLRRTGQQHRAAKNHFYDLARAAVEAVGWHVCIRPARASSAVDYARRPRIEMAKQRLWGGV